MAQNSADDKRIIKRWKGVIGLAKALTIRGLRTPMPFRRKKDLVSWLKKLCKNLSGIQFGLIITKDGHGEVIDTEFFVHDAKHLTDYILTGQGQSQKD